MAFACLLAVVSVCLAPGEATADYPPPIPVVVFAGQSNMVGYGTSTGELAVHAPDLVPPQSSVWFWGPTDTVAASWAPMTGVTEVASYLGMGFGPELTVGRAIAAGWHTDVAVVKLAVNGSNLGFDWHPDNASGHYPQLIARVQSAIAALPLATGRTGRVVGMFWMQGESDTVVRELADGYRNNLTSLVTRARADLGEPAMPFVQAQISFPGAYNATVRRAQLDVDATVPGVSIVLTDHLARTSDAVHLSTASTLELGHLFAVKFLRGE